MTGHLVFSTLHTNDAIAAIPRLVDLGVPDYLVAATVEGVLAQRLVRRICDGCREPHIASPESLAAISARTTERAHTYHGAGCSRCRGTGYRGRVGVFELLTLSEELKDAITQRAPRSTLRTLAVRDGMTPLSEDGWAKAREGLTTIEEVLRVVQ
jgi:type IV pilus assembly protein PilB